MSAISILRKALKITMPKLAQIMLIGIGLALLPMRIGMVGSLIGWGCLIVAVFWLLLDKQYSLGNKALGLPLLTLAVLQNLQGVELAARILPGLMFALYLISSRISKAAFIPVGLVASIGGLYLIAQNLIVGYRTGGLYSVNNYNIAIGAIILGAVLWQSKYQWLIVTLAAIAVLVSGAVEGLIALGLLIAIVLIRKDWGVKTSMAFTIIGATCAVGVFMFPMLWHGLADKAAAATNSNYNAASGLRLDAYRFALQDISWLGHGYNPNGANCNSIHSVPLIALQQTGIIGLGLWLWTMGYGIFKTRMKYAFIALFGLSLFDNYLWTQIMPYTWAIAGVASTEVDSDLIFRKEQTYASS